MPTKDNFVENRRHQRFRCSGRLMYTQFNTDRFRAAELVDFSQEGLGFVSQFYLKPRSHLFIRVDNTSFKIHASDCEFRVRSVAVAEVKWCREKADRHSPLYVTGVKYLYPGYR